MPTPTVENYIKAIYRLQADDESVPVQLGRIATELKVVPGTVTTMIRTLADAGLVEYEPRVGVRLTPAGEKLALHVLRRHRLVELFLVQVVGLDWSEVHEEAEELEHVISDKVLEKIDEQLGRPRFDPHGDPIPDAHGQIDHQPSKPLSDCAEGEQIEVVRIASQDSEFLRFARDSGLSPGNSVKISQIDRAAGTVMIHQSSGKPVILSETAARLVCVREA